MKILVTGGAGFIGTHLVNSLRAAGHEVVIYDLPENSVQDFSRLSLAMADCDVVFHLAAALGVAFTEEYKRATLNINIEGARNIVRACDVHKDTVKRLIYVSSSEVYGEARNVPTSEADDVSPRSVYAISKLAGEEYIKTANVPWIIVRPFNVYGPGQRTEFVISRFIDQALRGKAITVYGGEQSRAFCYVMDLVLALGAILQSENAKGKVMNIGNPDGFIQIRPLAEKIRTMLKSESDIVTAPSDRAATREIFDRRPKISHARKLLNWEPRFGLDEGLELTIEREVNASPNGGASD